jgi:hypothetical protein
MLVPVPVVPLSMPDVPVLPLVPLLLLPNPLISLQADKAAQTPATRKACLSMIVSPLCV